MNNDIYFNLHDYEIRDLKSLLYYNKKFNGFTKVKLNTIDRLISKEHMYGKNRMCPFGLFVFIGMLSAYVISMLLAIIFTNANVPLILCAISSFVVGIILQIIYEISCDKIDYNYLMEKNAQVNIYEWMESGWREV